MEIDANDVITAVSSQRNGALDETAKVYAMLQAANRQIEQLKAENEKLKNTVADSGAVP